MGIISLIAKLPMIILVGITLFIYISFMFVNLFLYSLQTFIFQLILDNYPQNEDSFFEQQVYGLILFAIFHLLLLILLISIIKTHQSSPGIISKVLNEIYINYCKAWTNKIRNQIKQFVASNKSQIKSAQNKFIKKKNECLLIINFDFIDEQDLSLDEDDFSEENVVLNQPNIEKSSLKQQYLENKGIRFCKSCLNFKPARCHHCKQCNSCWVKMDHHCSWINNCVGINNYKYFLNMIFWASCLLVFVSITYLERYLDAINDEFISDIYLFYISLSFYFDLTMTAVILVLMIFHVYLVTTNQTTIEFCEKKKNEDYDQGCWNNFTSVFEDNVFFWCIPSSKQQNYQFIKEPEYATD